MRAAVPVRFAERSDGWTDRPTAVPSRGRELGICTYALELFRFSRVTVYYTPVQDRSHTMGPCHLPSLPRRPCCSVSFAPTPMWNTVVTRPP
jgi:hypothetical protein